MDDDSAQHVNDPPAEETKPPFQFTIRTLMIVTVVVAVALAIVTQIEPPQSIEIILTSVIYIGCLIILRRKTPAASWKMRQRWAPIIGLLFPPVITFIIWALFISISFFAFKIVHEDIEVLPVILAYAAVPGLFLAVTLAIAFRINPPKDK